MVVDQFNVGRVAGISLVCLNRDEIPRDLGVNSMDYGFDSAAQGAKMGQCIGWLHQGRDTNIDVYGTLW